MNLTDLKYSYWRALNLVKICFFPEDYNYFGFQRAERYIRLCGVIGDVSEFGTWSGCSAKTLYRLIKGRRTLHLFDSFEGLPASIAQQDISNPDVIRWAWKRGAFKGASPKSLQRACPKAVIHKGWYSDTVPTLSPEIRFALIHIDCDLYQSTIDALAPLFSNGQVSEGALLIFDDWHSNRASNAYGERAAWRELSSRFKIDYEDDGSYGTSQKRIIVHGYSR